MILRTSPPFAFDPATAFALPKPKHSLPLPLMPPMPKSSGAAAASAGQPQPVSAPAPCYGLACVTTKRRTFEPIVVGTTREYGTRHALVCVYDRFS